MYIGTATVENSTEFPKKKKKTKKKKLQYDPTIPLLNIYLKEINHKFQGIPALPCSLKHFS